MKTGHEKAISVYQKKVASLHKKIEKQQFDLTVKNIYCKEACQLFNKLIADGRLTKEEHQKHITNHKVARNIVLQKQK